MKKIFVFAAMVTIATTVFANGMTDSSEKPLELIVAHNQTSLENPYAYAIIKFKEVAEAESEEEPLVDDGEDLGGGDSSAKEALMKKLSSITKSLEDAKNAVLKSL